MLISQSLDHLEENIREVIGERQRVLMDRVITNTLVLKSPSWTFKQYPIPNITALCSFQNQSRIESICQTLVSLGKI